MSPYLYNGIAKCSLRADTVQTKITNLDATLSRKLCEFRSILAFIDANKIIRHLCQLDDRREKSKQGEQ